MANENVERNAILSLMKELEVQIAQLRGHL